MEDKPKYYRCLTSGALDQFTVSKIYKVIDPNDINTYGNFIDNRGKPNGFAPNNHINFTPVTELEWNLQEGIITKISKENHSQLKFILKKLKIK